MRSRLGGTATSSCGSILRTSIAMAVASQVVVDDADEEDLDDTADYHGKRKRGIMNSAKKEA
jgi:hypothetical protein